MIPNLILTRDLNFTWSATKIWGQKAKQDPLVAYLSDMFDRGDMVDVEPFPICPTWRNGRLGNEGIAKRLDRFFISNTLID